MSDRDVLRDLIRDALIQQCWGSGGWEPSEVCDLTTEQIAVPNGISYGELADAIIAAGWRPPEESAAVMVPIPSGAVAVTIQQKRNGEITARFGFWGDDPPIRIT